MTAILDTLTPAQAKAAGREILRFNHRLAETGLFTDAALARLIDETPRADLTVCTMADNPPADERWIAGEANGLDGAALMEAARRGALWLSPRRVMTQHPAYRAVFERLMGEFSRATGIRVLTADGAVLISSPRMGVFYHVDPGETMLWHVRGHKTIHVYEPCEETIPEQALEAVILKETLSDLPYRPELEAKCDSVVLAPGKGVYWPLHSPHRVVNGADLNVSVTIEFSSPRSTLKNGVFRTNGLLRRRLGLAQTSRDKPAVTWPAYWVAAQTLRRVLPAAHNVEAAHPRQFDVDLTLPRCVRWRGDVAKAA